jgi:hypothetical protein
VTCINFITYPTFTWCNQLTIAYLSTKIKNSKTLVIALKKQYNSNLKNKSK